MMAGVLERFGVRLPVFAAPMAGGPTTPAVVIAAARAGGLGFLAGGYKSTADLQSQVAEVRAATPVFGVNLFAPNPVPVDPGAFRRYAAQLQPEADRYGLDLSRVEPVSDDDGWAGKIELLAGDPVPVVSFTFGLPDAGSIGALRRAGSLLVQTVTSAAEAQLAADAGLDALVVQSAEAGGHSGTFTPHRPVPPRALTDLVGEVRQVSGLPIVAAGGVAGPTQVGAALRAGADAVAVGTLLLLSPESGTSATYRAALEAGRDVDTVVTTAFSGRPARAVRNGFTDRYTALAPTGYPALHHLTSPLRKAAAAAADPERINIWAGTGHRAVRPEPVADVLARLAAD